MVTNISFIYSGTMDRDKQLALLQVPLTILKGPTTLPHGVHTLLAIGEPGTSNSILHSSINSGMDNSNQDSMVQVARVAQAVEQHSEGC